MRALVGMLCAVGLLGCASFPSARLVVTAGLREQVAAPVVCGPVGFRKVPLQARWGEYVRVTVAAPVTLRGSVVVHANGVAGEPHAWSTDTDGNLVVESRFENLDPDQRFGLSRERPIDLTITGLEAPAGGSCEGAVFTVEQGVLMPSIDERAWVAELERRGGPELAARREAMRVEMEARRQAHYAAWAQRKVEVSAEVLAEMNLRREAHFAAWEVAHLPPAETSDAVAASGDVCSSGACATEAGSAACAGGLCGDDAVGMSGSAEVVGTSGMSGMSGNAAVVGGMNGNAAGVGTSGNAAVGGMSGMSGNAAVVGTSGSAAVVGTSGSAAVVGGMNGNAAGVGLISASSGACGNAAVIATSGSLCTTGACAPAAAVATNGVCASGACATDLGIATTSGSPCTTGACAPAAAIATNGACASGACATDLGVAKSGSPCTTGACANAAGAVAVDVGFFGGATCAAGTSSAGNVVVNDAQFSRARGAVVVASSPSEWAQLPVDTTWAQPTDAQLSASVEWAQPTFAAPRLETVAVSSEQQVSARQVQVQVVPPPPVCDAACEAQAGFSIALPALFQVMLNVGASRPGEHRAVPAR